MGRYTRIPENTFDSLQLDAGILLKTFDPANPTVVDENIICATTGGINPSCVPAFSDLGEDVDNCPNNMRELKHLDSYDCKISFTSLGTSPELIKLALGCADIDAQTSAIVPRKDLEQTDFSDIWWVGDRADGGFVAIQLKNALSTGGFSLQTTKNGKGQVTCELTGHVSINDQTTMPMVFYSIDSDGDVYTVVFDSNGGTSVDAQAVEAGAKATEPSPAPTKEGYTLDGWFTQAIEEWDFATDTVESDMTLYAKWSEA